VADVADPSSRHAEAASRVPGIVYDALPARIRPTSLHMLRHPDRRTTWVGVGVLRFVEPIGGGSSAEVERIVSERLERLVAAFPIASARLEGLTWVPGRANPVRLAATEEEHAAGPYAAGRRSVPTSLTAPFDLTTEAPLRVLADPGGRFVAVAAHHAAIDGPTIIGMLKVLCGESPRLPRRSRLLASRSRPPLDALRRLIAPADPVAPSNRTPTEESFVFVDLPPIGKDAAIRLPEAVVRAIVEYGQRCGRPLRRIGISLSVAALDGEEVVASYRRVDVRAGQPVAPAIARALATEEEPWELLHAPRLLPLLAPVAWRLSDTVLVSDFGRVQLAGVERFEAYPVARGRSAVAIGATRVAGGRGTLTLRARDLSPADGLWVLERAIERLGAGRGQLC
jgi:hypothetical protein